MGVSNMSLPLDGRRSVSRSLKAGSWSRLNLSHVLCVAFGVLLAWFWTSSEVKGSIPDCSSADFNGVHSNGWDQAGEELQGRYAGSSVVQANGSSVDEEVGSEGMILENDSTKNSREDTELQEQVHREYPKAQLHNIVFGIAGTLATWKERQEYVRSWWRPGEMRGYVFMDSPEAEDDECTSSGSKDSVAADEESGEQSASTNSDDNQSGTSEEKDEEGEEKLSAKESLAKCKRRKGSKKKEVDTSFMTQKDPTLPELKYSGDFSQFNYTHPTGSRSAIRVARVVIEAFRNMRDDVYWYVMGDDDTIFAPDNLLAVLSKYDPQDLHYIGAPSESHLQNVVFSNYMAFGGGGFAISYRLAELLNRMFDDCLHRYPEVYGSDARIQGCVSELGVQMTLEKGFHQYDFYGNLAGALESHPLTPFVSLHHLSVLDPLLPSKSQLASVQELNKVMTKHPLEFLQQTMCLNRENEWSVSIAWGYSVRWYPYLLRPFELERAQRTFRAWNRGKDAEDFDVDTRNTPVTMCSMPSLFTISQAGWRQDSSGNATLLETVYKRANAVKRSWYGLKKRRKGKGKGKGKGKNRGLLSVGDVLSEGDGRERRRKLLGLCPQGMKRVPQSSVKTIRVLQPPLGEDWVFKPRRHCCKSLQLTNNATSVEIHLGPCQSDEIIG